jgi:pilus assembly protein Flp/PilA
MTGAVVAARRFAADEEGATMIEYCLMLGLIVLVCFAVVTAIGQATQPFFQSAENMGS